jgi:hypothetical protein
MDGSTAHELLTTAGRVRRQARNDRRATSVPLLVFGALTLVDAVLRPMLDPIGKVVLLLLAPIGFAFIALHYRRQERTVGVGSRSGGYSGTAVVVVVLFVFLFPLALILGLYALVGIGLLVIAVRQRNLFLGGWAVVYGVIGGLESLSLISNRLYGLANALGLARAGDGYFSWSSSLVYGVLGSALIGAGLYARRRELAPA